MDCVRKISLWSAKRWFSMGNPPGCQIVWAGAVSTMPKRASADISPADGVLPDVNTTWAFDDPADGTGRKISATRRAIAGAGSIQSTPQGALLLRRSSNNGKCVHASTIVSVRRLPSSMKQGAISAAMALSLTASESSEANAASAIPASCADPTRVTSQPCEKLRIRTLVYSRATVASVPSTDTSLLLEAAHAGLIAGTVPTKGTSKRWRSSGNTSVEAVLQATTTTSGLCVVIRSPMTATTRL